MSGCRCKYLQTYAPPCTILQYPAVSCIVSSPVQVRGLWVGKKLRMFRCRPFQMRRLLLASKEFIVLPWQECKEDLSKDSIDSHCQEDIDTLDMPSWTGDYAIISEKGGCRGASCKLQRCPAVYPLHCYTKLGRTTHLKLEVSSEWIVC